MSDPAEIKALGREVLVLIDTWHPGTVSDLVTILREKRGLRPQMAELAQVLKDLRDQGRLELMREPRRMNDFPRFLVGLETGGDFWAILACVTTLNAIIVFPPLGFLVPFRLVLGGLLTLLLPGYSMQMTLFPTREQFTQWKRLLLSVGLSIALVGIYSTILDTTTQGIILETVLLVLSGHTLIFSWIGILRRFEAQKNKP